MREQMFNINSHVLVRLTDHGRALHRKHHDEFVERVRKVSPRYTLAYVAPREDGQGWSRWQMWALMEEFGSDMGLGNHVPFETTMRLVVEE